MSTKAEVNTGLNPEKILSLSIPVVSFGGIILAIILKKTGTIAGAGTFTGGCIAGAFLLGYLAYLKPKKDIVALCAPLYAILIFVVPIDINPTIPLQLLFAASITILVIRLNRNFGPTTQGGSDTMEQFLTGYIERIRPRFQGISESIAHELAAAFFAFKFGLYANAVRECSHALAHIPDSEPYHALRKGVSILQANAQDLDNSQVTGDLSLSFSENELQFVAVNLPHELIEDPATLELDNALILIYAIALLQSPDDEQALDEHRKFVIRLLAGYKKALGIQ